MFFYAKNSANQIVSSGLVLYLDAANTTSYPGTGVAWTDLSGQGNNATLINGVSYSADNGGALVFNGINDWAEISSPAIAQLGITDHTISVWIKSTRNDSLSQDILSSGIYDPAPPQNGDTLLMIYLNSLRGHAWSNNNNPNTIDSPNTIALNSWIYVSQRVKWGENIDLFENTIKVASNILNGNAAASSSRQKTYIGSRAPGPTDTQLFQGNMAEFHVYNRALTDQEIVENFNATKTRFGL